MRVRGPSLLQLVRRGDAFADLVTGQIRQLMLGLAADVTESFTVDDLGVIDSYWLDASGKLAEVVRETYDESSNDVMRQVVQVLADRNPDADDLDAFRVADPVAEQYLQEAVNRLRGIGNEVWEHARSQLLDGFQLGESVDQLRDRLVRTTELAAPRAEVVARTEVIGASNAGAFDQMRATELRSTKEWLATRGPRTRPSHARVNGTVIPLDEKFTVGGWPCDRPHDPSLPPGESISCRCTLIFEVLDEEPQPTTLVEESVTPEVVDDRPSFDDLRNASNARELTSLANKVYGGKTGALRTRVRTATLNDDVLTVKGSITRERDDVGSFERKLRRDDENRLYATHDFIVIDPHVRGQNFSKDWNESMYAWYRANDVRYVRLTANIDVGGYAWAKQGFDWYGRNDALGVADDIESEITRRGHGYTDAQVAATREVLNSVRTKDFNDADYPTPYELATVGWGSEHDRWPGKQGMFTSRWKGIKWL